MIRESLKELYTRDLEKVEKEINAFENESELWDLSGNITNTPGNLVMHIAGNLLHFFGAVLGQTGYVREREIEFNGRLRKDELLAEIARTKKDVLDTLDRLSDEDLQADYPLEVFGKKMKTGFFLINLHGHLNYHLGQINYCRRILSA
ncbi:MAG: DinB family protein [Flavobacteriales bacterium]|nr:DinB family protein [Flavobacteriales bacterium]